MMGATLYLVGYRFDTGEYEKGAMPCQMCRKLIINAGIEKVIVRDLSEPKGYKEVMVEEWIQNDDLLEGKITY